MKRLKIALVVCLVASLLIGGLAYAVTVRTDRPANTPTLGIVGEIVGDPRNPQTAHRTFRLVRYRGRQRWGSPLSAGSVVVWHTGALTGDGVTVTDAARSDETSIAGVTVTGIKTAGAGKVSTVVHQYRSLNVTADIRNTASWGWLQTYGKTRTRCSMNITRDGAAFGASTERGMGAVFSLESPAYAGVGVNLPRELGIGGWWITQGGVTPASADCFLVCE